MPPISLTSCLRRWGISGQQAFFQLYGFRASYLNAYDRSSLWMDNFCAKYGSAPLGFGFGDNGIVINVGF